jgi:hypothetical protein
MISSIIFESALPLIPIPFGSFHIPDALLLFLLIMIPLQLLTNGNIKASPTPLDRPLLLFYLAAMISACISIIVFRQDFNLVMRQFRIVTYYLIYFVITYFIRENKQIKFVINGLLIIATIVGLAMILQSIVGESIRLMPGRLEKATSFEQKFEATRILPPGQLLIYAVFTTALCMLAFIKKPILKTRFFYIFLIVGCGVVLTYNRSYWISIILSSGILMILLSKRGKTRVMVSFMIIILLISVLSLSFASKGGLFKEYLYSVSERFTSLFAGERIYRDETLESRRIENEYLLKKIAKSPLIGIGLANDFRPSIFGNKDIFTLYIHNAYLWILASLGLIGFLPFFWFYISFLVRSFLNWKKVKDVYLKAALTGFMLSGLGILLVAIINPVFMQWYSIVVISTMIGLAESIIKINELQLKR